MNENKQINQNNQNNQDNKKIKVIEYDLIGLIPWFNDFFFLAPIKKIQKRSEVRIQVQKQYHALKHKYLPKDPKKLEKQYLKIKKKKKTSANSYGGRISSEMQSYYLNHLRKVYVPGNSQWTKGYHRKLKYRRPLSVILIDTKESPRINTNTGVLTANKLKRLSHKPLNKSPIKINEKIKAEICQD